MKKFFFTALVCLLTFPAWANVDEYLQKANEYLQSGSINLDTAIMLYTKAAELGNLEAQVQVGYLYAWDKRYTQSAEWFSKAAEEESADAQNYLAILYYNGLGVEQDYAKAVELYRKAAEQGHKDAQNDLAECYYYGKGVEQDYKQAVEWYRKAAEQGFAEAQYNLAEGYYYGEGVLQDYKQAAEWYSKAAEQGHEDAQYSLEYVTYLMYNKEIFNKINKKDFRSFIIGDRGIVYGIISDNEVAIASVTHTQTIVEKTVLYAGEFYTYNDLVSNDTLPTTCTHNNVTYDVVGIAPYAFENYNGNKSIVIPGSISSIADNAFSNAKNLESVTLDKGVIYVGDEAFNYCKSLKSVTIPSSVIEMGYDLFYGCKKLEEINCYSPELLFGLENLKCRKLMVRIPEESVPMYLEYNKEFRLPIPFEIIK